MNITQDPPPARNATAHSYNMAFPTTDLKFCIDIIILLLSHTELFVCTCFINVIDYIAL